MVIMHTPINSVQISYYFVTSQLENLWYDVQISSEVCPTLFMQSYSEII